MKFKNLLLVTFSFVFMTFQSCSKNEEIFAISNSTIESYENMNSSNRILTDERQEILANIENNNITVGADYKVLAADGIGAAGAFTSYGVKI